jgi:hypothetical protein
MDAARVRWPEILLLIGLASVVVSVSNRPREPGPCRHDPLAPLPAPLPVRPAAPSVAPAEPAATPEPRAAVCVDVHGNEAPPLRALRSRGEIERYSPEIVRLSEREPLPSGYRLVRALRLDPARDGADGAIELHHHRLFVDRAHSPRSAPWVFEDVSVGGDCEDHRLVLRWVAPDGAVRDQLSILSGYADVRMSDTPSRAQRTVWLEFDNCMVLRSQSHELQLFTLRGGRIEPAPALDERGEWTTLDARSNLQSRWRLDARQTGNELSVHKVRLYRSTRGEAHNRCVDELWRWRFDGRCWRGSVRRERVAGSEGSTECELDEMMPSLERALREARGGDRPGEPESTGVACSG